MIRLGRRLRQRDLVAFADGSLPAARRARVERAIARSPELQASIAAQRRALAALDEVAGGAPHALRAQLAQPALARAPLARWRLPALAIAGSGALALAAAAIVAGFAIGAGGAAAPTVADAAILANRPALAAVPEPRGEAVTLPGLRAAGLPYPYWEDRFGFKAVGVRHDRLGARRVTTVFYARAGERVAYTIVSGSPLVVGSRSAKTVIDGAALRRLSARGRRIVTWLRAGHTCVLSGTSIPPAALLRLAAWGRGDVPD